MSFFGGGGSAPVAPKPSPIPRPANIEPLAAAEKERAKRARTGSTLLTRGLLSTAETSTPTGKTLLGQ